MLGGSYTEDSTGVRVVTGDGVTIPVKKSGGLSLVDLVFTKGNGRSPQDTFVDECLFASLDAMYGELAASGESCEMQPSGSTSRDVMQTA